MQAHAYLLHTCRIPAIYIGALVVTCTVFIKECTNWAQKQTDGPTLGCSCTLLHDAISGSSRGHVRYYSRS